MNMKLKVIGEIPKIQIKRWLRALAIAKILFEDQGYHTRYLQEIEDFIIQCHKTGRILKCRRQTS